MPLEPSQWSLILHGVRFYRSVGKFKTTWCYSRLYSNLVGLVARNQGNLKRESRQSLDSWLGTQGKDSTCVRARWDAWAPWSSNSLLLPAILAIALEKESVPACPRARKGNMRKCHIECVYEYRGKNTETTEQNRGAGDGDSWWC